MMSGNSSSSRSQRGTLLSVDTRAQPTTGGSAACASVPNDIIDMRIPVLDVEVVVAHGINLAVFDFDQCVLAIHSYGQKITPEQVFSSSRDMITDFTDLPFFLGLITALRSRGIQVAIASFGRYEVIQAYLDRAFGCVGGSPTANVVPGSLATSSSTSTPFADTPTTTASPPSLLLPSTNPVRGGGGGQRVFTRTNISTPSTVGGKDGWSMQGGKNIQLYALLQQFGATPLTTMFFDDDFNNIRQAKEAGFVYSIPCPAGFDADAWSQGIQALQRGPQDASDLTLLRHQQQQHHHHHVTRASMMGGNSSTGGSVLNPHALYPTPKQTPASGPIMHISSSSSSSSSPLSLSQVQHVHPPSLNVDVMSTSGEDRIDLSGVMGGGSSSGSSSSGSSNQQRSFSFGIHNFCSNSQHPHQNTPSHTTTTTTSSYVEGSHDNSNMMNRGTVMTMMKSSGGSSTTIIATRSEIDVARGAHADDDDDDENTTTNNNDSTLFPLSETSELLGAGDGNPHNMSLGNGGLVIAETPRAGMR